MAPGAPQAPCALRSVTKFMNEAAFYCQFQIAFCSQFQTAFCSQFQTLKDAPECHHWGQPAHAPLEPCARHTSVPTGVQGQCHAQPCPQRHSSHALLHMAWTHSSGARTCSPRPGLQEPRAGDMSGVATAPSVPGCWHRDPEPSARPQLRGKHKHEAAPALAPHSEGFIYPNCQE